ncbi:conserved hypothetical protein, partial [Trichinella spiralis]|uniref:hypothetical protein n=1 Tax=Trichinella spiralis TaxID=6334 RepID=UPI0001EFE3EB
MKNFLSQYLWHHKWISCLSVMVAVSEVAGGIFTIIFCDISVRKDFVGSCYCQAGTWLEMPMLRFVPLRLGIALSMLVDKNRCVNHFLLKSEFKYFTMLESDELICLSSHLLDSNTLRGLYKVDKVAFLSHLVGDMHISMVSRIVMSMARILIY